ncbi:MAG TPA: hypothetical protein VK489_11310 [Ferruginibacter sp.]|nr:hypothetical protein [Ferruginibacter sp.]
MFDNFLRQKILGRIIEYKQMFHFKKEQFISIANMHEFFPPEKRFDQALINLFSKGYVSLKKEDNVQMVNIEEPGVFAFSNDTLRKEQYKIWWTYFKEGATLFVAILMAWIAILALKRDTSKFAEKKELYNTQEQLFEIKSKVSQLDSQLRIYQKELNNIKKSPLPVDTPTLKKNSVDKKK